MNWKAVILLLVAALAFAGCNAQKNSPAKSSQPVPVLVAKAAAKNVPVLITPPPVGHIQPVLAVTIRPQLSGVISTVNFQEGQEVKKGDLLFTLDARPAQAALTLAKGNLQRDLAQLNNARIQWERDQKLFEQKLISQDVLDTSKAAYDTFAGTVAADRASVNNAELNLQYTETRAPIDGITGSLQFHEGNVVKSTDDVLLTINQIHLIHAAFAIPERYLTELKQSPAGSRIRVAARYENLAGNPPLGELAFIDNAVDTATGTILLKAVFPNADSQLWPGQFVQLTLQLGELTNAVVVPSQAVQNSQSGQFVFVVDSNRTVAQRTVKTSVTYQGETVVTAGLQAGETVVTDGQLRLTPGAAVSFKNE